MKFVNVFVLFLLSLFLISSVSAEVKYIDTISGYSISNDLTGHKLFIECSGSVGCENASSFGSPTPQYIKYNLIDGTYQRYDNAVVGFLANNSQNPNIGGLFYQQITGFENQVDKYYDTQDYGQLLFTNAKVYRWNTLYNFWEFKTNVYNQAYHPVFGGCNFLEGYNVCETDDYDGSNPVYCFALWNLNSTYQPYFIGASTCGGSDGVYDTMLYNGLHNANTHISSSYKTVNNDYSYTTNAGTYHTQYFSWKDHDKSILYASGTHLYFNNQSTLLNGTDVTTTIPSCANIIGGGNFEFKSLDCRNANDCVIVGFYDYNKSLAFGFDGSNCYAMNLENELLGYNATNKPLNDVKYNPDSNLFYMIGQGVFMSVNSIVNPLLNPIVESQTTNFTIHPLSDNFYLKTQGGIIVTDPIKKYLTDGGVIYTYPANVNDVNAQMTYQINSQIGGYELTLCDYNNNPQNNIIYDVNLENCSTTTQCDFFPIKYAFNISNYYGTDRQIRIYSTNGTNAYQNLLMDSVFYSNIGYFLIDYEYLPVPYTNTTFSLATYPINPSSYLREDVNVLMKYDGVNICYYSTANSTLTNGTLIYCAPYSGDSPISNTIYYDAEHNGRWLIASNIDGNDYLSNYTIPSTNYIFGAIKITANNQKLGTFISNIKVYSTNQIDLANIQVPYTTGCTYELNKCYDTRIYFSWVNNDLSTYKDFSVCAVPRNVSYDIIPVVNTTDNGGTGTGNGTISGLSQGWKYFIALVIFFVTIILAIIFSVVTGEKAIGGGIGGGLLVFEMIAMNIKEFPFVGGIIPVWVTVVVGVIVTGIVSMFIRNKTMTAEN